MVYILDTDHLSILQRKEEPACARLSDRLDRVSNELVCTSIVNFQEQILGWIAYLNQSRAAIHIVNAYRELALIESYFRDFEILPFDSSAQKQFDLFRQSRVRIPTLDLRIACIAMVHDATLLSRNLRDFRKVPGLRVEDWTR
jgi:tRNA(fMet)-specific endonuclease VapC